LEDRRVLASLIAFDAGTGTLTVTMDATNDSAQISRANGNIEVNGAEDTNSVLGGTQTVAYTALRNIVIVGDAGETNQSAVFGGNYSTGSGGLLQNITVTNVNDVTFSNQYDLAGALSLTLNDAGGSVTDSAAARLMVSGTTTIVANDNSINLDNTTNDFIGDVNVSTTGVDRDISLADANNINFSNVVSTGDLLVTAGGNVTDIAGSTITADDGRFDAANVVLGENIADTVTFTRFASNTPGGTTTINQDNTVILLDVTTDNLTVRTPAGIFDGRSTNISVTDQAVFDSGARIRIGENGSDTFNAGSVNFNAGGHAHIWEDSSTIVTGTNTATSLNLYSVGSITDDATASINVTNVTGFEAEDVILGDTGTDQFNTGAMYFFTPGDFFVNEDSGIHIIETKNQADRMSLFSPGSITDDDNAQVSVAKLSIFNANSVNLGDSATDSFNSGSILFNTTALFKLTENSSTNIVSTNSANNAIIESTGDITDVFTSGTGNGSTVSVATVAEFTGANISLGEETNDTMNFGALRFNSPGTVTISEDSATNLTFTSTANQLVLNSTGGVTDATDATLLVQGVADIQGTGITLGDSATDSFNANSVTLNSVGAVNITENSSLNLHKTSTANSMSLVANGLITDGVDASTTVTNLFSVNGTLINLGSEATDNLQVGSLTFNSTLNANITTDSDVVLVGNSNSADQLFLTSAGNILDAADAETRVANRVVLTGVDVIIGELAGDCFDILNGDATDLFVTASGTNNVVLGC